MENDTQIGGDHYRQFSIQHWDYCWDHKYDQFQYCITKYVDRHKAKNGLEDLYKARHHLNKYIELLEREYKEQEQKVPVQAGALHGPGPNYVDQDKDHSKFPIRDFDHLKESS